MKNLNSRKQLKKSVQKKNPKKTGSRACRIMIGYHKTAFKKSNRRPLSCN